ncbi:MAG: endonuclease domain-containing protein [Nitrospinae bacterium]|nr:endonuclease domain-containing protein [Nitrospinota bacterium]MBL7020160.1 endonuclease domain-containing protein [Nitrospinaceae bacterium]
MDYIPYNQSLTKRARENRKIPTPAEQKIWLDVLQGNKFQDLKFVRQKPLDEYIVDFYCSEYMLAVEIDGDSHGEQEEYDQQRTERLNALGVTVIRYTNEEVMTNIAGVYEDLKKQVVGLGKP